MFLFSHLQIYYKHEMHLGLCFKILKHKHVFLLTYTYKYYISVNAFPYVYMPVFTYILR